MTRRSKALALASMWAGVGLSSLALAGIGLAWQMTMVALGVVGSAVVTFYVRTHADDNGRPYHVSLHDTAFPL